MAFVSKRRTLYTEMEHGKSIYLENSLISADRSNLSSVKITEYPDSGNANPDPVTDYQDDALEDFLSPQFLRQLTSKSNLAEVTHLEMEVDTSETSIGNLGQLLPNLRQLKLSNSVITSIRDLGTCLNDLTTLWLQRCALYDLDGISCFNSLKELYLAYNEIDDLSSLSMLDSLSYLDLEGNNVDDIAQVEFLALCTRLVTLTLSGNPIETAPHPDTNEKDLKFYDYRAAISKAVPQLRILDDEPFLFDVVNGKQVVRSTASNKQQNSTNLKEDILMVQESLKALSVIEEDEFFDEETRFTETVRPNSGLRINGSRPTSGRVRPNSSWNRPTSGRVQRSSSSNPSYSSRNRPPSRSSSTMQDRPDTASRPDSSLTRPESIRSARTSVAEPQSTIDDDDSSDLTHGSKQVLCGNPVRALLARRKELKADIRLKFDRNSSETREDQFTPEHSYNVEEDDEPIDRGSIFEELKRWRENFEKTSKQLVSDTHADETSQDITRSSLSPTPPSGHPPKRRPSRRKLPKQPELLRPQTASDFRPPGARDVAERQRRPHLSSKSMDMEDYSVERSSSLKASGNDESDVIPNINSAQPTMNTHSQQRVYRPGTAAAAYKKKSQKHFT